MEPVSQGRESERGLGRCAFIETHNEAQISSDHPNTPKGSITTSIWTGRKSTENYSPFQLFSMAFSQISVLIYPLNNPQTHCCRRFCHHHHHCHRRRRCYNLKSENIFLRWMHKDIRTTNQVQLSRVEPSQAQLNQNNELTLPLLSLQQLQHQINRFNSIWLMV